MRARAAAVQGGLAVVGLAVAWATWQREPERAASDAVVLEATKSDVAKVRFEDDKTWVELERRSGEAAGVWLRLGPRPDSSKPGVTTPERELRGNESAERLVDSFGPLRASRALGVVDKAKLQEFGLAAPDPKPVVAVDGGVDGGAVAAVSPVAPAWKAPRKVLVSAKGETRSYAIATPPGGFTPYLQDERDQRVYLLGGALLSDLESAPTRMVDRALHTWKQSEFDGLSITVGGKTREAVVVGAENPQGAKLASKATPDKADDTLRNWHDKVWRLYAVDVLGKGERPASGEPEVVAKIAYTQKGKPQGTLELGRVTPPAVAPTDGGAPALAAPAVEIFARSEHSAGWIRVGGTADEILKDAEKVAAAE